MENVKSYKESIPQWYISDANKNIGLVLSDDIDSLIACQILNSVNPRWKISSFYDFDNYYEDEWFSLFDNEKIWVDVDVCNGEKGFGNHVVATDFADCLSQNIINPNNVLMCCRNDSYTTKYAASTSLFLWGLYDLPMPESEEGKMLLLALDVGYKGYYSDFKLFYSTNLRCLEMEKFRPVLERHTEQEFDLIYQKYKLRQKIYVDDSGELKTALPLKDISKTLGLDIELPKEKYYLKQSFVQVKKNINNTFKKSSDIFSLAFTYKYKVKYSKIKE